MNLTYRFLGGQAGWLFSAQECGFHGTISPEQPTNNGSAVLQLYLVRQQERCASWAALYPHTRVQTHIYYAAKRFCRSVVTKFSSCDFLINFFLCIWPGSCRGFFSPLISLLAIFRSPRLSTVLLLIHPGMWTALGGVLPNSLTLSGFFHLTVQNFIVFFIRSGGVLVHHVWKSQHQATYC